MGEWGLGQVFIGEINVDKIGDKNACKLFYESLVYKNRLNEIKYIM